MCKDKFKISKIISDKEISTRIFMQHLDIRQAITLDDEPKGKLLECIVEVAKKLESVKYHRDNLLNILREESTKATTDHGTIHVDLTTGAERELEAFIMQGKSCLDVLTKIFEPLIGVKIHSYGNSGDKVISVLENNLSDTEKERASSLIKMIQDDKEWIEKWFKKDRDTITHYRSIRTTGFARKHLDDGKAAYKLPETSDGAPIHEIVIINYQNLLGFCEDFLALSSGIKFHPGISVGILAEEKRDKEYPRKFGMFMKNQPSDKDG